MLCVVGISPEPRTLPGTSHALGLTTPHPPCTGLQMEARQRGAVTRPGSHSLCTSAQDENQRLSAPQPLLCLVIRNHSLSQQRKRPGAFQTPHVRSQMSVPPQPCPHFPQAQPPTVGPDVFACCQSPPVGPSPSFSPFRTEKGASQPPLMAPGNTSGGAVPGCPALSDAGTSKPHSAGWGSSDRPGRQPRDRISSVLGERFLPGPTPTRRSSH